MSTHIFDCAYLLLLSSFVYRASFFSFSLSIHSYFDANIECCHIIVGAERVLKINTNGAWSVDSGNDEKIIGLQVQFRTSRKHTYSHLLLSILLST